MPNNLEALKARAEAVFDLIRIHNQTGLEVPRGIKPIIEDLLAELKASHESWNNARQAALRAEAERDELQARLDAVEEWASVRRAVSDDPDSRSFGFHLAVASLRQVLAANPAPTEEPTDD